MYATGFSPWHTPYLLCPGGVLPPPPPDDDPLLMVKEPSLPHVLHIAVKESDLPELFTARTL